MTQPIFYSPNYIVPGAFDTVSKAGAVAENLAFWPVEGTKLIEPFAADFMDDVHRVHARHYVRDVTDGKGEHGPRATLSVLESTKGMVSAAHIIGCGAERAGSLSSGMHHAGFDYGSGFCTLNGIAIAARTLVDRYGVGKVLIVDVDAHHGGGTWNLVAQRPEIGQVDVTVSPFDAFDADRHDGLGCISSVVRHRSRYLSTIERDLNAWVDLYGLPEVVILNAGMDPHEDDIVGGLRGITARTLRSRDRLIFEWADDIGAPVLWALAGGYVSAQLPIEDVVALHRSTVEESAR